MRILQKIRSIRILIIYMVTALLFLTTFDLHIHTHEHSLLVDHGVAVDISSFSADFMNEANSNEITVSPDSVLKIKQNTISLLVILLLIAVLVLILSPTVTLLRERRSFFPVIPFYGAPSLRAPPK